MYPLQPQSSARFASQFTMYLPLIFKIVACVRKFHAVVLKEPVYLEARFKPKQTASFSLGELALPVRFQNQGLQGLPGQLSRIGAEPAGQFLGNFDRDDHVLLHFTRIPDDAAWAPPLSRPLPSSTTTMLRMESAGVGRRACGVAGVVWRGGGAAVWWVGGWGWGGGGGGVGGGGVGGGGCGAAGVGRRAWCGRHSSRLCVSAGKTARRRYLWLDLRTFLRSRIETGVTSTSSSSRMNSMACSRFRMRGGTRRMPSSEVEARILVSFFSLTMFTSRSASRAFSPTIIPS